ncbi:hypothetical protein BDF21DRAFT_427989 [Thamnidium elegans]|nr:hypothetical protein BDF21DRAFT_427989 [Thamnidium elegans]
MNHRSIPSLSSSISSSENNTPRTSSSSCSTTNNYYLYQNFNAPPATEITKLTHTSSLKLNNNNNNVQEPQLKRYSEPLVPVKRWDDSQLEMELAEDDLIMDKKKSKVRRNSSLRFKQSYIIDKFRHHRQEEKKSIKFTRPFKKLYDWLF